MKFLKDLKAVLLFYVVIIILGLSSCDKSAISELDMPDTDPTTTTFRGSSERTQLFEVYNLNYSKWKSRSISNYKIVEKIKCGECFGYGGLPHQLTVVNNATRSIKDEKGVAIPKDNTLFRTIEGLFKFTETSLKKEFAGASIKYNAQYGYPELVYFDFNAEYIDEEMGYAVIKFSK